MAMFVSGTTEFYIDIHTRKCFSFRYESISATGTQKIKFLNYNTKEIRRFDSFIDSNLRILILWMKGQRVSVSYIFTAFYRNRSIRQILVFRIDSSRLSKESYGLHPLQISPSMSHKLRTKKHLPPECPNLSHSPTGKLQVIPNEKKLKNLNITETDVEAAGLNIGVGL